MLWNFKAQRESAKMGNLTQELDRGLRVAILQFAVCRTHAAQRLNLAPIADRRTRSWLIANFA